MASYYTKEHLQKAAITGGNSIFQYVPECFEVLKHKSDVKVKNRSCRIPSSFVMGYSESIKNREQANKALRRVIKTDRERQKLIQKNIEGLNETKEELQREVEKIEISYFKNVKRRENDKLETLSKLNAYIDSTIEIKREREKQDILIRIGLIVEALFEDLEQYETILGKLSLLENVFKSKVDNLAIKKKILLTRMQKLNALFTSRVSKCEDLRKHVFDINFKQKGFMHYKMNLINQMVGTDTKSMRAVLDLELQLANLRKNAYQVQTDNARFFWFIDWALFDVFGAEMLIGINKDSSPLDKVQCIIDSYKNVREHIVECKSKSAPTVVDDIFT